MKIIGIKKPQLVSSLEVGDCFLRDEELFRVIAVSFPLSTLSKENQVMCYDFHENCLVYIHKDSEILEVELEVVVK